MSSSKVGAAREREKLRGDVPRLALEAGIAGRPLRDVARDVLGLARAGLSRRAKLDANGRDEAYFLDPLDQVAAGRTQAEILLAHYREDWNGNIDQVFETFIY